MDTLQIMIIAGCLVLLGVLLFLKKKEQANQDAKPAGNQRAQDKKADKYKANQLAAQIKAKESGAAAAIKSTVAANVTVNTQGHDAALSDFQHMDSVQPVKVSVQEVNPLTEYKVYKEFGYLDKAAESLRQYLASHSEQQPDLQFELTTIYLELERYDALADFVMDNKDSFSQEQIGYLVKQGLEADANNLELRVLADELLHWDVDTINNEILSARAGHDVRMADEDAMHHDANDLRVDGVAARFGSQHAFLDSKNKLVMGQGWLRSISQEELQALSMMVPADKAVKLMRRFADYTTFSHKIDRVLSSLKNPAAALIDVLGLDYQNKNHDAFVRHLWELYNVLGKNGQNIKDKMLAWGYGLGRHEVLDRLALSASEQDIKDIGNEFGYRRSVQHKIRHSLSLVNDAAGIEFSKSLGRDVDSILQEADAYLMYGQLGEAMSTLENGIKQYQNEPQLYATLFELYERAENWTRLEEFSKQLRTNADSLPEEVILVMSQLTQKFKNNHIGMMVQQ